MIFCVQNQAARLPPAGKCNNVCVINSKPGQMTHTSAAAAANKLITELDCYPRGQVE